MIVHSFPNHSSRWNSNTHVISQNEYGQGPFKKTLWYTLFTKHIKIKITLFSFKTVNYSYRTWTNNIYCNRCWFWCSFNTAGSFSCNIYKVCKTIIYFCDLTMSVQLFMHDDIPNSNEILFILYQIRCSLSICRRYSMHPFTTQIRCTAIYKTNQIVDLNWCTRMLNTWITWTETKCHTALSCSVSIMVFNATLHNISVISCWSVILVVETG
jgi:hypothetical protein